MSRLTEYGEATAAAVTARAEQQIRDRLTKQHELIADELNRLTQYGVSKVVSEKIAIRQLAMEGGH